MNSNKQNSILRNLITSASEIGDVNGLERLFDKYIFIYDNKPIDIASANGHHQVLKWWKSKGLEFKFTNYAINHAYQNMHVSILLWWVLESDLVLKFDKPYNPYKLLISLKSIEGKIPIDSNEKYLRKIRSESVESMKKIVSFNVNRRGSLELIRKIPPLIVMENENTLHNRVRELYKKPFNDSLEICEVIDSKINLSCKKCSNSYKEGDQVIKLRCNHLFHTDCQKKSITKDMCDQCYDWMNVDDYAIIDFIDDRKVISGKVHNENEIGEVI